MPEMDGYEFARAIRKAEADKSIPRIPIIAWTANALAEEEGRCREAGMDALLVKPANLSQLRQALAKWLSLAEIEGRADKPSTSIEDARESPVDYSILNAVVPDSSGHARVLKDFLAHVRDDQAGLSVLIQQGDLAGVVSMAHRMKGSCRMVGATFMARACEALEQAASNESMDAARKANALFDRELERLTSFISEGGSTEDGR
jgi:HPt (histidine-containing phosphotransfer) domain-containing protein